jgi:hypothetical protein
VRLRRVRPKEENLVFPRLVEGAWHPMLMLAEERVSNATGRSIGGGIVLRALIARKIAKEMWNFVFMKHPIPSVCSPYLGS